MVGGEGKFGASSYAERLTPRQEKGGGLGNPEHRDDEVIGASKIMKLVELLRNSKKCVVLTGAGISTSAGVSDFRGPNGVWTAEKKGIVPPASKSFDVANPTLTHMALVGLVQSGHVDLVISQNVDGLHLRSGLSRRNLAELHGNLFMETCEVCGVEYLRDFDVGGISCRRTGRLCERAGCGGALRDNLLDWEDALPEREFVTSETALAEADLCICMGTSLRIRPASELPLLTARNGGKLVVINLQKTPKDRHAHLRIHLPVDEAMRGVMALLRVPIPSFQRHLNLWKSVGPAPGGGSGEGGGERKEGDGCSKAEEEGQWGVEVFAGGGRGVAMPMVKSITFFFDFFDGPEQPVAVSQPPFRCLLPTGLRGAHALVGLAESCTAKEVVVELALPEGGGEREVLQPEEVLVTELCFPQDDREEEDRIMMLAQQAANRPGKRKAEGEAGRGKGGAQRGGEGEGVRQGRDWRRCGTCGKAGRPPRSLPKHQPWYCRRRCQPQREGEAEAPEERGEGAAGSGGDGCKGGEGAEGVAAAAGARGGKGEEGSGGAGAGGPPGGIDFSALL